MALESLWDITKDTTVDEIRKAVAAGADPNAWGSAGNTPLHCAHNAEQTRVLLDAGADPNPGDNFYGLTPLSCAQNAEQTKLLLSAGADPNACGKYGKTPLHFAHDAEQTKALLAAGANIPDDLGERQQQYVAMAHAERLAPQPDVNPAAALALKSLKAGSQAPEQPSMRQRRRC